jgi:phage-related protein
MRQTSIGYFAFFDSHSVVVLTHGFEKKSMKTPRQEIEKAETYRQDYLFRKGKIDERAEEVYRKAKKD